MKTFKKYQNYFVYGGMLLTFLLLVLIATRGAAPYSSTAFRLGSFGVQWYAVFILTGIVFGGILAFIELKRFNMDPNIIWDGLLIFIPSALAGARLWYVIFNLDRYTNDPLQAFDLTRGGLGIHGAIIVVFLGLILYTKYKKVNYFLILDLVAPGFLIGQTLGRWGNFMNRELYGPEVASLDWLPAFIKDNMVFGNKLHHPTFLYESIWNLIGLILILAFRKQKFVKIGDIVSFYLVWYGIGRIPNEILRMSSGVPEPLMLFNIPVSIATSVGLILAGLAIFIGKRIYAKEMGPYNQASLKAVLFDLDGTVIDTIQIIYKTLRQTFAVYFPELKLTEKELKPFVGPTLEESFGWYEKDPTRILEMIETYRNFNRENHEKDGVKAFPHAKELFQILKSHNYKIGIVSSKQNYFVKLGLSQNDLLEYVDCIIGSDDTPKHKPDPLPLKLALEKLEVSKDRAFYVGDHPFDIEAAKALGIPSIGVSYTTHLEALLASKPDYLVDDLEKILYIL